jgi:hypothetical protein
VRRVPFSRFARPESFSTVSRASGAVFMFCAPRLLFGGTGALGTVFMFCAPGHVFGGTEGVASRFHVLRARIRFRRCRVRLFPFSRFASSDSFSAVPMASCAVFVFCAPGLVFGGTEGVGSRFHVLRARTRFRRCRARRVPFASFALSDLFLEVPSASSSVFTFCAP